MTSEPQSEARTRLIQLMKDVRDRRIPIQEFCDGYEHVWNFEVGANDVPDGEVATFQRVFEAAAFYNPFEESRRAYSGFTTEEGVLREVEEALGVLG